MDPVYGWGPTATRLEPLSSQKLLIIFLLTLEEWNTELTLEPVSGFEHRTHGLGIQHLKLVPLPHNCGSTSYYDVLHNFSAIVSACYKYGYATFLALYS